MADTVTISGFDKAAINGVYSYWKVVDGFDAFQKDSTHIVMYRPKLGEWSQTPSYYILENKQISGGIKKWVPIARSEGTSIASPTWITMKDVSSGEQTVGTTVYDEVSSSSSSIDSSSSSVGYSSSSSVGYSSSSSSVGYSSSSSVGYSSSSSSIGYSSSSSSYGQTSSSSSSYTPPDFVVTGSLTPDATGNYYENGVWVIAPAYERTDGAYWIYYDALGGFWRINDHKEDADFDNNWYETTHGGIGAGPAATYSPLSTNTGTATVT